MFEFPQTKNWTERFEFYQTLKELRDSVYKRAEAKYGDEAQKWWGPKVIEHMELIRKKSGEDEILKYIAGHILTGSTVPEVFSEEAEEEDWKEHVTGADFEGELSVEGFYKQLLAELE